MKGVNKVILIGHLGKDPEVRYIPSGGAVASASLATSDSWKDKQTGEKKEHTEWHNLTFFGRGAEVAGEYLKKGSKVYIEGKIKTEKWQDKEGKDRYTTKIIVGTMQMLDGKGGGQGGGGREEARPAARREATEDYGDFDDDIPF